MTWFSIDGIAWEIPCQIERIAEIKPSEISGMLMDKSIFNDIHGTYLRYEIAIAVPFGMEDDYASIYEILTQPVGTHTFVFPYNNTTITISGSISEVEDALVRLPGDTKHWKGTKFTVTANNPSKTMSLSEVLAYGMNPYPASVSLEVGSLWERTSDGWVERDYKNADDKYYGTTT